MTQIRSKGLYIFFNIPSVFDLDRNLVLNRCHLLLHCFQNRFGDRGKYIVFDHEKLKFLYLKGKKLYSYGYPKANFSGNFGEFFPLPRKEYEDKKQKEIAKQAKSKKQNRWKQQRDSMIAWMNKNLWKKLTQAQRADKIANCAGHISDWQVEEIIRDGSTLED